MDEHKAMNDDDVKRETLTTRQGRPIIDNQNIKTIGNRARSYVLLFRYATLSCRFQLLTASCQCTENGSPHEPASRTNGLPESERSWRKQTYQL